MEQKMFKLLRMIVLLLSISCLATAEDKSSRDRVLVNTPSGPLQYIEQPFDVLRYEADIDLTAAPAKTMSGKCKIIFKITGLKDTSDFIFHLRGLNVDSVFYYNTKVNAEAVLIPDSSGFHYRVPLSTTAIPSQNIYSEDSADIVVWYHGAMTAPVVNGKEDWGGVHSANNILYAMGVGFNNEYISATQHWLPCYDHPSDKAAFTGRFRTRTGKACASIGLLEAIDTLPGNTIEWLWKHDMPCATYLNTFAVGDYILIKYDSAGLPYYIFTLKADSSKTAEYLQLLPRMVSVFENRFVKYPYDKVGYVLTPTGSMEHQTMISLYRYLINYDDGLSSTAAHELAHQWFGDYVSCYDFRDAWLSEGFASFCESLWAENLYDFDIYLSMQDKFAKDYKNSGEGIFSLYDYPRKSPSSNYPITIYYKGAAVIGMMRYKLGDEAFFEGLRNYLNNNKYGNVTTDDLETELENASGTDLGDYFDQWVYGKGYPCISVTVNKIEKQDGRFSATVRIVQVQPDSMGVYTYLPVEMGFKKSDGTYDYRMLIVEGVDNTFPLDSLPEFTTVTVNQGPSVRSLLKLSSLVTAVEESNDRGIALKLLPNPADDRLTVVTEGIDKELAVIITDIFGKIIYSGILKPGEEDCCINTGGLATGVYFLVYSPDGRVRSCPFTIMR